VVAIISSVSSSSEALEYEIETVVDERRKRGNPSLTFVRVGTDPILGPLAVYADNDDVITWNGPEDDGQVAFRVLAELSGPRSRFHKEPALEPTKGAVPIGSPFYTLRESDSELEQAIKGQESVILVRGPRQVGKTSSLARAMMLVDTLGWRQVSTDFQKLNAFQLFDVDKFCLVLAKTLARQQGFAYDFAEEWVEEFGPNLNLDHFVRALVEASPTPLVWFMDEADRIFSAPFASDFYGLVRTWHNARATDPRGPWSRLTIAIGYATEARLFIQDLTQSPFNIGREVSIKNFTTEQTNDLNRKYERPIKRASDVEALQYLLGGHPFLTRKALELLSSGKIDFSTFTQTAAQDAGPYGDHLKRVLYSVSQEPGVLNALKASLTFRPARDEDSVQRLIAAGILKEVGDTIELSCDLYTQYLSRHLGL
jgi:hypothetical protein